MDCVQSIDTTLLFGLLSCKLCIRSRLCTFHPSFGSAQTCHRGGLGDTFMFSLNGIQSMLSGVIERGERIEAGHFFAHLHPLYQSLRGCEQLREEVSSSLCDTVPLPFKLGTCDFF